MAVVAISVQVGHPGYNHGRYDPSAPSGSDVYAQNVFVFALIAATVIVSLWSHWTFIRPWRRANRGAR